MLVKRRLSLLVEILDEYEVQWDMFLVPSAKNKADIPTRVPQSWLKQSTNSCPVEAVALSPSNADKCDFAKRSHTLHHCGVDTTLYFARQMDPRVTREEADLAVKSCRKCQSIDPSPVRVIGGELSVEVNWQRIAVDVTHHGREKYLTLVDCGPSRFAIWRRIESK